MAGTHQKSNTAVKTKVSHKRILLWAAAGVLLVAAVIVLIVLLRPGSSASEVPGGVSPSAAAESSPTGTPTGADATPAAEVWASPAADAAEAAVTDFTARAVRKRDGFALLSWDPDLFYAGADGRIYYNSSGVKTLTGIDVSEHQYDIDWAQVAASGIDFAMIRMGYRGSTEGQLYEDKYFTQNMEGALANGISVGVYFYSQAVNVEEAQEEAEYLLEHLKGYDVTFPVVFDWEIVGGSDARTYSVDRRTLCKSAAAFCDAVEAAGYDAMIYFTQYLGYRKYILRSLAGYGFWYAEYESSPRFAYDFDMWQYTCWGRVNGITEEVDMNILFVR